MKLTQEQLESIGIFLASPTALEKINALISPELAESHAAPKALAAALKLTPEQIEQLAGSEPSSMDERYRRDGYVRALTEQAAEIARLKGLLEQPEAVPVAWQISYRSATGDRHRHHAVHGHNAVGDYRMIDADATSTPLYIHPPAPNLVMRSDVTDEVLNAFLVQCPYVSLGATAAVKTYRINRLLDLVRSVHAAKGRHHSQIAMCNLYDACGLPNTRPEKTK